MSRIMPYLAAGLALLALAGCGGDDDDAQADALVITPDLSELPPEADAEATLDEIVDILRARASALGIEATIERQEDDRISVEAADTPPEEAIEIFTRTAFLTIALPALGPVGQVLCQAADGTEVSVPRENVSYPPQGSPNRGTPRCVVGDGTFAELKWLPASAQLAGIETALTGEFVESATLDTTQGSIVIVTFNESGSLLLISISEENIGLPLGVFLDRELVAAPTIAERIITANVAISGLGESRGRVVAAQLTAGPLPIPVSAEAEGS